MTETTAPTTANSATSAVFAWIGAILVNGAFIVLICFGVANNWIVGFVFSVVYAVLIFLATGWLHRHNKKAGGENEGHSILTTLLYLLAAVAIGVPGILLLLNLLSCPDIYYSYGATWYTNTTGFSDELAAWVDADTRMQTQINASTFAYIPATKTTIFAGSNASTLDGTQYSLWKTSAGEAPTELNSSMVNPSNFIQVSNGTAACFTAQESTEYYWYSYSYVVGCSDGTRVNSTNYVFDIPPTSFLYADGKIWFKNSYGAIHSVDPADLSNVTLHSTKVPDTVGGSGECDTLHVRRMRAVGMVVLSIIPVFVASIALHVRRGVPSMPLVTYSATMGIAITLACIISPAWEGMYDLLRWWLSLTSLIWLLSLAFAYLTHRIQAATLSWSANFAGLVFIGGMFMLFLFPFGVFEYDVWWRWILITLIAFFPLIGLGVIINRTLLVVLGALGVLIDVWRFTDFVRSAVGSGLGIALQAVILAISGLGLAFWGLYLSKQQPRIQEKVDAWSEKHLGKWMLTDREIQNDEKTVASVHSVEAEADAEAEAEMAIPAGLDNEVI